MKAMTWRVISYHPEGKAVPWPEQKFDTEMAARAEAHRRVEQHVQNVATLVLSPDVREQSVRLSDRS